MSKDKNEIDEFMDFICGVLGIDDNIKNIIKDIADKIESAGLLHVTHHNDDEIRAMCERINEDLGVTKNRESVEECAPVAIIIDDPVKDPMSPCKGYYESLISDNQHQIQSQAKRIEELECQLKDTCSVRDMAVRRSSLARQSLEQLNIQYGKLIDKLKSYEDIHNAYSKAPEYVMFNINYDVHVKLKQKGLDHLTSNYPHYHVETGPDGYMVIQLWEFISLFGDVTRFGMNEYYHNHLIMDKDLFSEVDHE